jgi:hypothetical protein
MAGSWRAEGIAVFAATPALDESMNDVGGAMKIATAILATGRLWSFVRQRRRVLSVAVLVLLVGTLAYAAIGGRFKREPTLVSVSGIERDAVPEADHASLIRSQTLPLPTAFGVYAITQGRLSQLEPLRVKVPDQRVSIGPAITMPTQTVLPDGKVAFIVYRRDLMFGAPDKVSVRVMARIARAITFNAGKPGTTDVNATWAVRGKSYELGVSPVEENQEMVIVRPESEDFMLPAGRYALVLKGLAYDFSVDGEVTDPWHCLERVEAVNGNVYSDCRNH